MPSKYTRNTALPLRVPPELRADVDALVAALPRGLVLSRNTVAVAALRRGVDALRAELGADPFAVHRALAAVEGEHQVQGVLPSTSTPAAGAPIARGNGGARAPRTAPGSSRRVARLRPSDEGPVDRAAERSRPRAAPAATPRRVAAPSTEPQQPEGPDAPSADAVRELLATVLDRDRAVKPGSPGWTVKALAAALGCNRKALQAFRADGSGMGRPLQLRLWEALRRDPPAKG